MICYNFSRFAPFDGEIFAATGIKKPSHFAALAKESEPIMCDCLATMN
jgi:hypothetical protein